MRAYEFIFEAGAAPIYYFAYGMLTDPANVPSAKLIGAATLPNFQFEMFEYANVIPKKGSKVIGTLWELDRKLLQQLDQVEEYPTLYDRKTVPVFYQNKKYAAELYTMTPATRREARGTKPDKDYIAQLERGYANAGIPISQLYQSLTEGGWDTKKTQSTVLKPAIVATVLNTIDKFTDDFNAWLKSKNLGQVKRGKPTGSGSYYQQDMKDNPDKIYGDIDLQMIGDNKPELTIGQYNTYWNKLADEFIRSTNVSYVDLEDTKPGHPIFSIGKDQYVQVDFMWHPAQLADWGAARVTPERGIKGLLMGNMYSALGEILDLSIQHAGVQLKTINGQQVPFSKKKDVELKTISTNPGTWVLDILKYYGGKQVDPLLKSNPGTNTQDVRISTLANAIKGLARSFELNNLYGKGVLDRFSDADDFINKFVQRYTEKAIADINAPKRDKAETPEAKARAEADRQAVKKGLEMVQGLFAS